MEKTTDKPSSSTPDAPNVTSGRVSVVLYPESGKIEQRSPLEKIEQHSSLEKIAQIFSTHPNKGEIDEKVLKTLDDALKGQSWAMKDLFYYINNNKIGLPVSEELGNLGIAVLKEAATSGNQQANRDLKELTRRELINTNKSSQKQSATASLTNGFSKITIGERTIKDSAEELGLTRDSGSQKINIGKPEIKSSLEEFESGKAKETKAAPLTGLSPIEIVVQLFSSFKINHKVQNTLNDAVAGSSQAKNDLFYYANNGYGGVPKNQETFNATYKVLQEAAADGNKNAVSNLAYIRYHGLDGNAPSPKEAIASMKAIGFASQDDIFEHWQPSYGKTKIDKLLAASGLNPENCITLPTETGGTVTDCGLKTALSSLGVNPDLCEKKYINNQFLVTCPR